MRTKERGDPQPTDLNEKLIALRRRTASRPQKQVQPDAPPQPPPVVVVTQPKSSEMVEADDFSRRLKISSSPASSKLFNPDRDRVPTIRRTQPPTAEQDALSDAASSSHAPRGQPRGSRSHQQLFDHRKDDPVRFSVLARPSSRAVPTSSKSTGDYVSASSTSSYAPSQASSSFTLSSNTDGSSASSALFDGRSKPTPSEEAGQNVFALQLKRLYRTITTLENNIKQEHEVKQDDEDMDNDVGPVAGRILLRGREAVVQVTSEAPSDEAERDKWKKQITEHKRLVDTIHNLLEISLSPSVPASLRNIPTKYNIIVRLWTYGFYKLLESLRRASFNSSMALEHLQDFIYYAYTFYTGLLEEPQLNTFRSGWLEALGDLALYKMAVVALVKGNERNPSSPLDLANLPQALTESADTLIPPAAVDPESKPKSNVSAARIDDSPSPSIGPAAARLLDLEPEKDRWRAIARDWYGKGLADQPGTGKLHHHLGLLCRDVEGEELRGVYHYVKSLTTLHPFTTSRESILPFFSQQAQAKRVLPDSNSQDLFVLIHGMLFTNINLDDFTPTLARFMERLVLEEESIEERTWVMMAVVNVAAVLEYGKSSGVLRKLSGGVQTAGSSGPTRVLAKRETEDKMEVDGSPMSVHQSPFLLQQAAYSPAFTNALTITFTLLSHVLKRPTRKTSPFALRASVNPYLSVLLTFLSTILKQPGIYDVIARWIPWEDLRMFCSGGCGRGNDIPTSVWVSQGLVQHPNAAPGKHPRAREETWVMLTSATAPPLPEDWCLRGMEWVGRKVYERGFWKSGDEKSMEGEFLDESEVGKGDDGTDGRIESDDDEDVSTPSGATKTTNTKDEINQKRWIRVLRSAIGISNVVDGFSWVEGTKQFVIEGSLKETVAAWKEEERLAKEDDERRRQRRGWDSEDEDEDMEIDEDNRDTSSDDEETEEIKELKARRQYLESVLRSESSHNRRRRSGKLRETRDLLPIMAGYTVLVIDTNLLLSYLPSISALVESLSWTVVIPLPVIMELDGLSSNPSEISVAAKNALAFMSSHIRSHSMSLKVLTSKGNYLSSLSVRAEEVSFSGNGKNDMERNMDDLILKAAIWQDEHWVDRSGMLKSETRAQVPNPVRVVLMSLDRNLRLKSRSRDLPAASEKDLAVLLTARDQ